MKKDIESTSDIRQLVELFFDKIKQDALLSPFFTEYIKVNRKKHVTVMTAFWENAIFYNGSYTGNPMQTHYQLHKQYPITTAHFDQWVLLFIHTANELFEGEKTLAIKQKAIRFGEVMKSTIITSPS